MNQLDTYIKNFMEGIPARYAVRVIPNDRPLPEGFIGRAHNRYPWVDLRAVGHWFFVPVDDDIGIERSVRASAAYQNRKAHPRGYHYRVTIARMKWTGDQWEVPTADDVDAIEGLIVELRRLPRTYAASCRKLPERPWRPWKPITRRSKQPVPSTPQGPA